MNLDKFKKKFTTDPSLFNYVGNNKLFKRVEVCYWYNYQISTGEWFIMLEPYQRDKNGELEWTEDRIGFDTYEKAEKFCKYIGCSLERIVVW